MNLTPLFMLLGITIGGICAGIEFGWHIGLGVSCALYVLSPYHPKA